MKKYFGVLIVLFSTFPIINAQKSNVGDGKWSVGGGIQGIDLFSPKPEFKYGFRNPIFFGPRAFVWKNFNPSFSVSVDLSALFGKKEIDATLPSVNSYKFNTSIGVVYKLNNGYIFKTTAAVAPYIFAQVQGSLISVNPEGNKGFGVGLPLGAGINWRLTDDLALQTQAGYTFGLSGNFENQIFYSTGIIADLKKKAPKEVSIEVEKIITSDTDNDGIIDLYDACPTEFGIATFNGCPDTDGDGTRDSEDSCPEEFGLLALGGCPDSDEDGIPNAKDLCPFEKGISKLGGCPERPIDTDGDGIVDINDNCPTIFGVKENNGCPEIDTDKDGIADKTDQCPYEAGPLSNGGCPIKEVVAEIKEKIELNSLNFETGKTAINNKSKEILDKLIEILKKNPTYKVSIIGHTDNIGNEDFNVKLSLLRAKVVLDYLVLNKIDAKRINIEGNGSKQPIADNNTEEGRAKNRRSEIRISEK
ncbi:MAG: OmpA family protein [Bacteroidetes bacterium]|nr:OmpA family protein [Bacteroidota bacterium]